MTKSLVVFGAGPGVGRAVARRYGKEGYEVVLVARRPGPLEEFAAELAAEGIAASVVTADLSRPGDVPALAAAVRARVGDPAVIYYGPARDPEFTPASSLDASRLRPFLALTLDTLLALVAEFLPAMLARGDGAILTAQGAAAVEGHAGLSGWPALLAAQRHYLQSLAAEVDGQGVYVGRLYVGARITGTAYDEEFCASGQSEADFPAVDPDDLADLLWTMHAQRQPRERVVPQG